MKEGVEQLLKEIHNSKTKKQENIKVSEEFLTVKVANTVNDWITSINNMADSDELKIFGLHHSWIEDKDFNHLKIWFDDRKYKTNLYHGPIMHLVPTPDVRISIIEYQGWSVDQRERVPGFEHKVDTRDETAFGEIKNCFMKFIKNGELSFVELAFPSL